MPNHVWELRKGDQLLGTLKLKEADMFSITCDFESTSAFEPYRSFFAQEADRILEDGSDIDSLYAQIGELNLSLHIDNTFDDENIFWLHILDNEAWFRALKGLWVGGWVNKEMVQSKAGY